MPQRTLEQIYVDLVYVSDKLDNSDLHNLAGEIKALILSEDEKKAAKEWKKGLGALAFKDEKITVEVYRNDKYPGIMIHKEYNRDNLLLPEWTISHELSGIKLTRDKSHKSMRQAVKAFRAHAAEINWDGPKEDILTDPKAKKACYKLSGIELELEVG